MAIEKQQFQESSSKLGRVGNRPFWILKLSIILRALHQVGAAVFLATYLLDFGKTPPLFYIYLTVTSGTALLLAEWMRHRQIYRELSGASTLVKLLLLGAAYHGLFPQTPTILIAFLLASIASHAPKLYRHRLLY